MKKIIVLIIFLFSLSVKAQLIKNDENRYELVKIIEIPNKNADNIYNLIIEWSSQVFKNPDEVIRTTIPKKLVSGRYSSTHPFGPISVTIYTYFTINIKDGKARVIFDNIRCEGTFNNGNYSNPLSMYTTPTKKSKIRKLGIKLFNSVDLDVTSMSLLLEEILKSEEEDW